MMILLVAVKRAFSLNTLEFVTSVLFFVSPFVISVVALLGGKKIEFEK